MTDHMMGTAVLAGDFSILLGSIEITVPEDLEPGSDYDIVREYRATFIISSAACKSSLTIGSRKVFGDSGNESPIFTIL